MTSKRKSGKGEPRTSAKRIKAAEKQAEALKLRAQGIDFRTIADRLGYRGPSGSYKAVQAALAKTLQEPADELRQMELLRLNQLWRVSFALGVGGDGPAIDRCLRIMERRAKLLGLDASFKYTVDDIESIAKEFFNIITKYVEDKDLRERIFTALRFTD